MKDESPQIIKIGDTDSEGLLELSTSKIKTWRRCQFKYQKKYRDGLRPRRKAVPLRRGSWVHSCLESRDTGGDWIATIKKMKAEEYDKLFLEEKVELGDLPAEVFRIMRAYHQTYLKVDTEWETIRCEQDFKIRIPGTPFVVTGKIDKIARHKPTGQVWIWEHKTMKKSPPTESYRFTDIQTAVYMWVLEQLAPYLGFKKGDISGILFDYIRTKAPTIPRVLKDGTMSQAKIDCDRWTYMAELKKNGLDPKDYRDFLSRLDENVFFVRVPLTKSSTMVNSIIRELICTGKQINALSEKDITARSLDWTCDRPKCEYQDLCIAELEGADTSLLIKLNYTKGDEEKDVQIEDEEGD